MLQLSDVINSPLGLVITPSLFRFRSSSPSRVYDDYYFCVDRLFGCMGVDAQLLLVATTSLCFYAIFVP